MARTGPTTEAIVQFSTISCLPHDVAAEWLKLFDNDVDKTTNAFFDDPGTLLKKRQENVWNESDFHKDNVGQQTGFAVHHQDSLRPGLFDNLAPSRPPSRNSINLNDGYIAGNPRQRTLLEQEEYDLQQAMELSASQKVQSQQSGTTVANDKYFGPEREYHDTKHWIMTTTKSTANEIIPNPEPKHRRRQSSTPAFLRPSPAGHRLPGVVKILHAIPAAREALLSRNLVSNDYGHQNEWWDGATIESPRIIYSEAGLQASSEDVISESQRLMAFLDDTERAYGSSEGLSNLPSVREDPDDTVVKRFINIWENAVAHLNSASHLSDIFRSHGTRIVQGGESHEDISIVELDLTGQHLESGLTLYDAMDAFLWPCWDGTEHDQQVFFEKVADVLIFNVTRKDATAKGVDIKIPPVWYSDRYHQSSQPRIQQMLAEKAAIRKEIEELKARKQKASEFKRLNEEGTSLEVNRLLEVARQHLEKTAQFATKSERAQAEALGQPIANPEAYSRIAEELKTLSDRVAAKLQLFEESKEKARGKLRELSELFTEPSNVPEESPRDRYTLRGVCAGPHTVYVQERTNPPPENDLLDLAEEAEWQWWRLHYEASTAQPIISCTKVREIEVLNAARHEAPSAFLVYASDRAMAVKNGELPFPLRMFVQADNRAFAAEIAASSTPQLQPMSNNPYYQPPMDEGPFRYPDARESRTEDYDLPTYEHSFPAPPRDTSYDHLIPASLRQNSMDGYEPIEMTEREGASNAFGGTNGGAADGYRLGSYVPEFPMQDGEEAEEERMQRGRE
ncbi:MAG: hypothetical protein Q9208_002029 [Pyrenodesmia sp. 3 TL-2023]